MKTIQLLCLAVVVAVSPPTYGAVLRMEFGGGESEASVVQFSTFVIDVWLDKVESGGTVSGISMELNGDQSLEAEGNFTNLPGWRAAGNIGRLTEGEGALSHQFLSFAEVMDDVLTGGPGSFLLGQIVVRPTAAGSFPIVFNQPTNTAFFVADVTGADLFYSDTLGATYDSYVSFGQGRPELGGGIPGRAGLSALPITLHVTEIPEPAALALLGLGAIVALRRRMT